jgi:hypothetical protein
MTRPCIFVHQDQVRVVGQAPRQRNALLHAAGQLIDRFVAKVVQADDLQKMVDLFTCLGLRLAGHVGAEGDVLFNRQPFKQRALLEHHAAFGIRPPYLMAVQHDGAFGR